MSRNKKYPVMTDSVMSPRSTKYFWDCIDTLSISILPSISVYTITEKGVLFIQILDDFYLTKENVEKIIWIHTTNNRVRVVLKHINNTYMYLKIRNSFDRGISAKIYSSSALDLIERRMSNETFDAYRTRRKH